MSGFRGRVLGIDYGRARVGLAVTDALGLAAHPIGAIEHRGEAALFERLSALIEEREVVRIVLGLPLNMDGSKGPAAREVERFAERLGARFGLPVDLWDERLSSREVEAQLEARGIGWRKRKKRRGRIDAGAAALILTEWMRSRWG